MDKSLGDVGAQCGVWWRPSTASSLCRQELFLGCRGMGSQLGSQNVPKEAPGLQRYKTAVMVVESCDRSWQSFGSSWQGAVAAKVPCHRSWQLPKPSMGVEEQGLPLSQGQQSHSGDTELAPHKAPCCTPGGPGPAHPLWRSVGMIWGAAGGWK